MIEERIRRISVLAISLSLLGCLSVNGMGKTEADVISEIKLNPASLPEGITITREIKASSRQLVNARLRIGFPLISLVNQTLADGKEQAKVNYMLPAGEEWFDFGYSKLVATEGDKSLIVARNLVIIQMAAATKDLENKLLRALAPDPVHLFKIRIRELPEDWTLVNERCLLRAEKEGLGKELGEQIQSALIQEFIVRREKVTLKYYDCVTQEAAERAGHRIINANNTFVRRKVKSSISVVVVVESQDERLVEDVLSRVNW